ncbi:hypothetical protein HDZ31DRAFT_50894, partial [Schizophyllum fasciatum]
GIIRCALGPRASATKYQGLTRRQWGAYQEYTIAPASTTFPIPDNTSFEDASTLPLAAMTAVLGLFVKLGIPAPGSAEAASNAGKALIINGASSSVGAFTVQLAKRAGLFVVGIAGASKAYAVELGADAIVDYREHKSEADLIQAIVAATAGRPTPWGYDAISGDGTTLVLARALAELNRDGHAKLTFLNPASDAEAKQTPATVVAVRTYVGTAYAEDEEFAAKYYRQISQWLADKDTPFVGNRVKIMPGGLDDVAEGLNLLKENKVHGEKLVYCIADTRSLKSSAA